MSGRVDVAVRLLREDDAPRLAGLLVANRDHLAPWEPVRDERFATEAVQRAEAARLGELYREGRCLPGVMLLDGEVVGRVNVNNVVRGAFLSGNLGYWVAADVTGRGVATAAVAAMVRWAFGEEGLHRLEAGTLLHNTASQRVLLRNGFTRIGVAPSYLRIAGRWQDHVLFHLVAEASSAPVP